MKRTLIAILAGLLSGVTLAQTTPQQPASLTITPSTLPEVLQVLDSTGTWVPMGTVNQTYHKFASFTGGTIDVTTVGMQAGGTDNSPYVLTLMNAIAPGGTGGNAGGLDVVFPGTLGQAYTGYYFSSSMVLTRNANYRCTGTIGANGVELIFPAGVQGVVQEQADWASDHGYGGGAVNNCLIVSLGFGEGNAVPNSSSITGVAMNRDPGQVVPASTWHVGDGIIATPLFGGAMPTAAPAVQPGAYVSAVSGANLTLASGFTTSANLQNPSQLAIYQLPASLKFTMQTTSGSGTALVTGGPRLLVPGEVIWAAGFPFGTTVFTVSGTLGAQTIQLGNSTNSGPNQNAPTTGTQQMWIMPAGLRRNWASTSNNNFIIQFPIGLQMSCEFSNCTGSYDTGNFFETDLVGRWTSGANTSASSSINEKGAGNFITDYLNAAVLGEVAVNFNSNSGESANAAYVPMGNCQNENWSVAFGGYWENTSGGCAQNVGVVPPGPGAPWLIIVPQSETPTPFGANAILSNSFRGPWAFHGSTNSRATTVGTNSSPYTLSFGDDVAGISWGFEYGGVGSAWFLTTYYGAPMAFLDPSWSGYSGRGTGIFFPTGIILSNTNGSYSGEERLLEMGPGPPSSGIEPWHLQGDTRINNRPVPGGNLAFDATPSFTTTLAGAVTGGTTASVAVAACPSPALPAGTEIAAYWNGGVAGHLDQSLGLLTSCSGTTLTLQSPATVSSASGTTIQFLEWRPAGHVANDVAGTSWPVATRATIATIAPCGPTTVGFGIITDGVASPVYNSAIGTTGFSTRPVFCDGTSWTYH